MAVGYTGVAELNSYFNNIYEDAVFAVHEQTIATRLVRNFTNGRGDQTRSLTTYPTITPVSVAETEDFAAPTAFDKSLLATLTPGEVMSQVLITDRRIETDPQNARQDAAVELAAGFAEKIDKDIFGNFNALTGGTVGSLGGTMLWGYLYAAVSRLRAASVPRPYYAVLHPYAWHDLATTAMVSATATNAPDFRMKYSAGSTWVTWPVWTGSMSARTWRPRAERALTAPCSTRTPSLSTCAGASAWSRSATRASAPGNST